MLVIYLLPWFVLLLLMLLGAIVNTHMFGQLAKINHAPEIFDTALLGPIRKLLS